MLLQQWAMMNTKMFCCIRNVYGISWIESRVKHRIGTYETNKISLSCFDDKYMDAMN